MKSFIQQFRDKEINIIIQEIVVNLKLKKNWDSLIFEQFGLYVTAKNNNKFPLGFDMWYDIPSEGYEWAIGNKITPFDFISTTIIIATMWNTFSHTSIK